MSKLSEAHLHDEVAAIEKSETILWPNGPVCPHCGGRVRITKVNGATARPGLWRCGPCKRQFTVTVGTLFERSHVKMHLWFQAVYLMAGFAACQLQRTLGVTYKTAWFMAHRIREAMRTGDFAVPFGVGGGAVEADETFIGSKEGPAEGPRFPS
jgi:transposase-like protein